MIVAVHNVLMSFIFDLFGKNCMHKSGVLHAAHVVGVQFDDLFIELSTASRVIF